MNPKIYIPIILTLVTITIMISFMIIRYKLFTTVEVKEMSFGSGKLLFIPYQGEYTKIGSCYKRVMKELSDEFGKNVKYFGVYYDDPNELENKNEARAIIGGCFADNIDLEPFVSKNSNYKMIPFNNLTGFGAEFPLYGFLSIYCAVIRGYSAICKYGSERKLFSNVFSGMHCSIEFYDYNQNIMTIAFPHIAGNETILSQSGYATPKLKSDIINKNK